MNEETTIDGADVTVTGGVTGQVTTWESWHPDSQLGDVVARLARVSTAIGHVGKGDRNTAQGFNFRGVDAVVNASAPAFRAEGIVPVPRVIDVTREPFTTAKGSTMMGVHLIVEYRFYGPTGAHVAAVVAAESFDSGDKATAKAMSVAYRTALLQVLCLPTDEPTDPDHDVVERGRATERAMSPDERRAVDVNRLKGRVLRIANGDADSARALWDNALADIGLTSSGPTTDDEVAAVDKYVADMEGDG